MQTVTSFLGRSTRHSPRGEVADADRLDGMNSSEFLSGYVRLSPREAREHAEHEVERHAAEYVVAAGESAGRRDDGACRCRRGERSSCLVATTTVVELAHMVSSQTRRSADASGDRSDFRHSRRAAVSVERDDDLAVGAALLEVCPGLEGLVEGKTPSMSGRNSPVS